MTKIVGVIVWGLLVSCSGTQGSRMLNQIPLGQARALEILAEATQGYGQATANVEAQLTNGTEINIDIFVPELQAGFAYLNEQDRTNGAALPQPAEESDLYALLARRADNGEQVHVLVVQDTDFRYLPNPRADERRPEDTTIGEVEARLRRDGRDFLQAIVDVRGGSEE
jgi:hypothetical protein